MLNYESDDAVKYDSDDVLTAVKPRVTPSPSPTPVVTDQVTISSSARNVSSPSRRRRKKPNRREKTKPSLSDFVLFRSMEPNRPDIAQQVGERALNSDSGSEFESETEDDQMEDRSQTTEPASESAQTESTQHSTPPVDLHVLRETAQKASQVLDTNVQPTVLPTNTKFPPLFPQRDSVVEVHTESPGTIATDTSASHPSHTDPQKSAIRVVTNGVDSKMPANISAQFPNLTGERHRSFSNGNPHDDIVATSPNLRESIIPASRGSPSQKLPALQNPQSPARDGSIGSLNQDRTLPSFHHLSKLAETALHEQETSRVNGYPHRQSISSISQSPTSGTRQLSISSPFPPLSASSPVSANSEIGTRDPFLRSGQHLTLFSTRRPSQASDHGPYSGTIHSASTDHSYQSSDGLSPGTQATPIEGRAHRMSIDGAMRTLPPPVGPNIQHIPPHGSGGFKCEYPSCNAPPFQTQYLLKLVDPPVSVFLSHLQARILYDVLIKLTV
jgi:hypothetical protein